ncbi:MAG: copper chaperone PCu(A)C [Pyrinomonadaceae bacterium]
MKRLSSLFALLALVCACAFARDSMTGREAAARTRPPAHFAAASSVSEGDADKLVVRDAWIQEGPPSQKITAAFMLIENHAAADTSLVSASTDAARVVELHKMELEGGMMKMRRVEAINVPAGGSVELKPGGYHLMVIGLKRELKEGDEVKVTLRFAGDVQKTVTVPVKKRDSAQEDGGSGR